MSTTGERVGARHAANAIGLQICAAGLGGAVLPALAGVLARRISLEAIPLLQVILTVVFLGLHTLPRRRRPESFSPS